MDTKNPVNINSFAISFQMKILKENSYDTTEERMAFLGIVNANLLEAMHTILAMMDPLGIPLKKGSSGKVNYFERINWNVGTRCPLFNQPFLVLKIFIVGTGNRTQDVSIDKCL